MRIYLGEYIKKIKKIVGTHFLYRQSDSFSSQSYQNHDNLAISHVPVVF